MNARIGRESAVGLLAMARKRYPECIQEIELALEHALDQVALHEGRKLMRKPTEFETAARLSVKLIASALAGKGDPNHIIALASQWKNRTTREWLRVCTLAFEGHSTDGQGWVMLPYLPNSLSQVDEKACNLNTEQIRLARRNAKTAAGFAASLAVDCGALGYVAASKRDRSKVQGKAQRAFANLSPEGKS